MKVQRGEVWLANLDPTKGSEQGGTRPVIIFQDDIVAEFSTTIITIPLTTNLRRAYLPTCLLIESGEGGLERDSVALCHQLRVIDKTRLQRKVGVLTLEKLTVLEGKVLLTLGYSASGYYAIRFSSCPSPIIAFSFEDVPHSRRKCCISCKIRTSVTILMSIVKAQNNSY